MSNISSTPFSLKLIRWINGKVFSSLRMLLFVLSIYLPFLILDDPFIHSYSKFDFIFWYGSCINCFSSVSYQVVSFVCVVLMTPGSLVSLSQFEVVTYLLSCRLVSTSLCKKRLFPPFVLFYCAKTKLNHSCSTHDHLTFHGWWIYLLLKKKIQKE